MSELFDYICDEYTIKYKQISIYPDDEAFLLLTFILSIYAVRNPFRDPCTRVT